MRNVETTIKDAHALMEFERKVLYRSVASVIFEKYIYYLFNFGVQFHIGKCQKKSRPLTNQGYHYYSYLIEPV